MLCNKLTAAISQFDSKFFDLESSILPPMIDDHASTTFKLNVQEAVSRLPIDVQKKVGDEAFFFEVSADGVQGMFTAAGSDRKKIVIAAGLDRRRLQSTVVHEIAHLWLNHKAGGYHNEKAADDLAAEWGFTD